MRGLLTTAAVAAVIVALAQPALAQRPEAPHPNSMASTGDSITRAFNSGAIPWIDTPRNSWSTGGSGFVESHYRRILAVNRRIFLRTYNDARSGAKMANLRRQVTLVNLQRVDYVTVLIGANDACASSVSAMTPVAAFRAQFVAAMDELTTGSPDARVYVVSIPNVYRLWRLFHGNPSARLRWRLTGLCKSMLANPRSTAPADMARRRQVRQRIVRYNAVLAETCAVYARCHFDGNAVFEYRFQRKDVSTRDYFHPSREGQRVLAAITWRAGYRFIP